MRMFLCLVMSLSAFGAPVSHDVTLKQRMIEADPGSYIVAGSSKIVTLLRFHAMTETAFLFEEITAPKERLFAEGSSTAALRKWIEGGAPGHTSRVLYTIDREHDKVVDCYSLTRNIHLSCDAFATLLPSLLRLRLIPVPLSERIRTGATVRPGKISGANLWTPPMIREGRRVDDPHYDVRAVVWPKDGSEFAGKKVTLYLDGEDLRFPFPYLVVVGSSPLRARLRAVDSGKGLLFPNLPLPRTPPFSALCTD